MMLTIVHQLHATSIPYVQLAARVHHVDDVWRHHETMATCFLGN